LEGKAAGRQSVVLKHFVFSREGVAMSEQPHPKNPAAPVSAAEEDLSRKIEGAVDREPLDLVKCVHLFGNFYRCNWWARSATARKDPEYAWLGVIAGIVRKSRFLSATMDAGELIVKEIGPVGVNQRNFKETVMYQYSDEVLRRYAESGLRTVEDWIALDRDIASGVKPRLGTMNRGLRVLLYSRDQTQRRIPSRRRSGLTTNHG
jgi:hypothetical protein